MENVTLSNDAPTTEVTPQPQPSAAPLALQSMQILPEWWTKQFGNVPCITSINPKGSRADRIKLLEALNSESDGKADYVNTTFEITDYVMVPASKTDDEGETAEFIRTVLILDDGRRIAFGSNGIVKSLLLIIQLIGPAPWKPPLRAKLVVRALGGMKQWPVLEPIMEDEKPAKRK